MLTCTHTHAHISAVLCEACSIYWTDVYCLSLAQNATSPHSDAIVAWAFKCASKHARLMFSSFDMRNFMSSSVHNLTDRSQSPAVLFCSVFFSFRRMQIPVPFTYVRSNIAEYIGEAFSRDHTVIRRHSFIRRKPLV